jgi:heme O synthase-like polyprenyltransferase
MWDGFIYLLAIVGSAVMALMMPSPLSYVFALLCAAVFVGMCLNAFRGKRLRESARKTNHTS